MHMPSMQAGITTAQDATARDMIRLLKLYRSRNLTAITRRETAKAIKALADSLEALPDAGRAMAPPPPPRGDRPFIPQPQPSR